MMKMLLLGALILAGCAETPRQVMEDAAPITRKLALAPRDAAYCMASNVQNHRPTPFSALLNPTVRPLAEGQMEMVVQTSGEATTIAVARLAPEGKGSIARIWLTTRTLIMYSGDEGAVAAFVNGC